MATGWRAWPGLRALGRGREGDREGRVWEGGDRTDTARRAEDQGRDRQAQRLTSTSSSWWFPSLPISGEGLPPPGSLPGARPPSPVTVRGSLGPPCTSQAPRTPTCSPSPGRCSGTGLRQRAVVGTERASIPRGVGPVAHLGHYCAPRAGDGPQGLRGVAVQATGPSPLTADAAQVGRRVRAGQGHGQQLGPWGQGKRGWGPARARTPKPVEPQPGAEPPPPQTTRSALRARTYRAPKGRGWVAPARTHLRPPRLGAAAPLASRALPSRALPSRPPPLPPSPPPLRQSLRPEFKPRPDFSPGTEALALPPIPGPATARGLLHGAHRGVQARARAEQGLQNWASRTFSPQPRPQTTLGSPAGLSLGPADSSAGLRQDPVRCRAPGGLQHRVGFGRAGRAPGGPRPRASPLTPWPAPAPPPRRCGAPASQHDACTPWDTGPSPLPGSRPSSPATAVGPGSLSPPVPVGLLWLGLVPRSGAGGARATPTRVLIPPESSLPG